MKKLIKTIAHYEGKKSETSIANLRETMKVYNAIIVASIRLDDFAISTEEMKYYSKMSVKAKKKIDKNPGITFDELVKYLLGRK